MQQDHDHDHEPAAARYGGQRHVHRQAALNASHTTALWPKGSSNSSRGEHSSDEADSVELPPVSDHDEMQNGGPAAWLTVTGAFCTAFCSFGWLNSVGIFQEYYKSGPLREYSESEIAWIPSLQIFFMMAVGPVAGKIFDSYGPRWLLVIGSLLHVFGICMASFSTSYYQILLSQGVCSAIGAASIFQPSLGCIMAWFPAESRGLAYGIVTAGSSVGGVVFPILATRLLPRIGYAWTMRVNALLMLVLLSLAVLTVRARHPPPKGRVSLAQLAQPFKEVGLLAVMAGVFLLTFGLWVPITYLTSEAVSEGMDVSLARYLVAILNAGSAIGRLGSGFVADRLGKYNVFVASCYTTAVLVLALWIPARGDAAVVIFTLLFGTFSGAFISLMPALVAQVSPLPEIGWRTGLVFLMGSPAALATGPIAGAILTATGNWAYVKVFGGVMCLTGTTSVLVARLLYAGGGWKTVF